MSAGELLLHVLVPTHTVDALFYGNESSVDPATTTDILHSLFSAPMPNGGNDGLVTDHSSSVPRAQHSSAVAVSVPVPVPAVRGSPVVAAQAVSTSTSSSRTRSTGVGGARGSQENGRGAAPPAAADAVTEITCRVTHVRALV